ncbi:C40 family peptidase [Glutamicibacter sp. 363]|uniref:C40 family peptidase n=1 Tax=Glutamicibacter sp. 363 TaxID=3457731 RepID=UPI00403390E5
MNLNRSNTTFTLTLIALIATCTSVGTTPEKPRDTDAVSVTTYKTNPHAVFPVNVHEYDAPKIERASLSALKKIDPTFHYDLDSPSVMELSGETSSSYPSELIYEWPEDKEAKEATTPPTPTQSEPDGSYSDAMVRPEYRGEIIAVSENISPIAPDTLRQKIVDIAVQYVGAPYVWGGNTPNGWDCSGFVKYAYGKAGINTARTTSTIRASGQFKRTTSPQPGDLVFQNNGGHVGIYLGNGRMIGAQNPSVGTIIHNVSRNPLFGYYTLDRN